jgi:hypothetical protein
MARTEADYQDGFAWDFWGVEDLWSAGLYVDGWLVATVILSKCFCIFPRQLQKINVDKRRNRAAKAAN